MSTLSKMAIQAGLEALDSTAPDFSVFCSQHGELHRTVELLESVAKGLELSPTAFSQSVHNSSAGLFSIITRSNAPTTSLASGESTFAYGWLEAEAYLANHREASVLLVGFEEPLPVEYQPFSRRAQCAYAVGVMLRAATGRGIELERTSEEEYEERLPIAPLFMAWWLSDELSWRVTAGGESWTWSRSADGA